MKSPAEIFGPRTGRSTAIVLALLIVALIVVLTAIGRGSREEASGNPTGLAPSPRSLFAAILGSMGGLLAHEVSGEAPQRAGDDLTLAENEVLDVSDTPELPLDSAVVSFVPSQVPQGTLFRIRISPETGSLAEADGTFAGEPLHFRPEAGGALTALAAAPVSDQGSVELQLEIRYESAASEIRFLSVPVVEGDYRMERLTVAPQFGRPQPPEIQARINEESARAMRVSRRSHDTPRMWEAPFRPPRETPITSGFGHGRMFNDQVQSRHMGTDFRGGVGEPVLAPARGVVALVDSFYLGGNVIYVDHGDGLVTAYLHLSEQEVQEGDIVEPGQLIGRVGATGRVTGPHLHWIVRYGVITVDGMSLLKIE